MRKHGVGILLLLPGEAVPNEVTKIVGLLRNLFAGWDSQVTTGVFFALVGVVWGVVGLSDRLLTQYSIYLLGREIY